MSINTFDLSSLVAPRAVAILASMNSLVRLGNRGNSQMFVAKDYAPGDTINLREDNFFVGSRGDTVTAEDIVESTVPLTIQPLFNVTVNYKSSDLQRDIVSFTSEIIEPAVRRLSTMINDSIYNAALTQLAHYTGDITAPLNTFQSVSGINPVMTTLDMNKYGRNLAIDPYNFNQLVGSSDLRNSFLPSLNEKITIDATLGRLAGFEIFQDTSIAPMVTGTHDAAGAVTVTTLVTSGSLITLGGFNPGATFVAGDLFTVLGSYEWAAVSQRQITQQKQLVVTAPAVADITGAVTLSVFPAIITTGPKTNVFTPGTSPNQIPAGAVVLFETNFTSGYLNQLAFTDRGLQLALPPMLPLHTATSFVSTDPATGISLTVSQQADIYANVNTLRISGQMGVTWLQNQCVRVLTNTGA